MRDLPGVLLANPTWYGTLAAARDLGAHGVPVTLAGNAVLAPARWSRHVARAVECPSLAEPEQFLAWLLEYGQKHPGLVLYPTSDDLAWLLAVHREALCAHFLLYSPSVDCLGRLLDKARLSADAKRAGLASPETRCPQTEGDVESAGEELGFPLIIKPRSQVLLTDVSDARKGIRVERPEDLLPRWRQCCRTLQYRFEKGDRMASAGRPALQAYHPTSERIYTVDGFVDESGQLFASLACTKTLQRPRGSGPGILFEDAPPDPAVELGLQRLFSATGFHGVFDAEFLEDGDRKLLIDLNPRYYNHMAFEVDRGLPLPWLAYLAAIGARIALQKEIASARAARAAPRAYVHRVPAMMMLTLQTLRGTMAAEERRHWGRWLSGRSIDLTDPAYRPGDAGPAIAEVLMELAEFLRHPRSFLRHLAAAPLFPRSSENGRRRQVVH